jgi:hypothetical protein
MSPSSAAKSDLSFGRWDSKDTRRLRFGSTIVDAQGLSGKRGRTSASAVWQRILRSTAVAQDAYRSGARRTAHADVCLTTSAAVTRVENAREPTEKSPPASRQSFARGAAVHSRRSTDRRAAFRYRCIGRAVVRSHEPCSPIARPGIVAVNRRPCPRRLRWHGHGDGHDSKRLA